MRSLHGFTVYKADQLMSFLRLLKGFNFNLSLFPTADAGNKHGIPTLNIETRSFKHCNVLNTTGVAVWKYTHWGNSYSWDLEYAAAF